MAICAALTSISLLRYSVVTRTSISRAILDLFSRDRHRGRLESGLCRRMKDLDGVNDVIAAVLCVVITEYVTRFYYSRPKVTFPLALLNNFKMGFTYGLFIDAFKLAS
ncbi:UNVERIFIED_CONTAM: putative protein ycf20 [Sesamum calycinum]|uniref:Uncharacterized protein n=1 Tax=Sesamum calycinum TaxID=2727403 RepID=A0AAW2RQX4_9LAMI